MPRLGNVIARIAVSVAALAVFSQIVRTGYTRIDLTVDGGGGSLFTAVVPDGERVTLTWRNSQFGLQVTEEYFSRGGELVQDRVTFHDPGGAPPPIVSPRDVGDLYHTGGAFDARGLSRPLRRIVYRVGEIGDPRIRLRDRTVSLHQAAGFGGRTILTASLPGLHEILRSLPETLCAGLSPGASSNVRTE